MAEARVRQGRRFAGQGLFVNAQMSASQLRRWATIGPEAQKLMESAMKTLGLSARAYSRILKLARTIADLESSESIEAAHLAEAIGYRSLDRGQAAAG